MVDRARGEQRLRAPDSPGPPAERRPGPALPPRSPRSPRLARHPAPPLGSAPRPGALRLPQPGFPPQARAYRAPGAPCRAPAFCPRRRRRRRLGSAAPTSRPRLLAGGAPARGGGPEGLAAPWPSLIGRCELRSRALPMESGRVEVTGLVFFFRGGGGERWSGAERGGAGRGRDGRGMKGRDQRRTGPDPADLPHSPNLSWANLVSSFLLVPYTLSSLHLSWPLLALTP